MNLNQVTVPALDVNESIAFYEKLGLTLIVHTHEAYARFECPNSESTFSIHKASAVVSGEKPVVYFECDNLDEKVRELVNAGLVFQELPNNKEWLWREAHILDPSKNKIILFRAGENRKNPPWRIRR